MVSEPYTPVLYALKSWVYLAEDVLIEVELSMLDSSECGGSVLAQTAGLEVVRSNQRLESEI